MNFSVIILRGFGYGWTTLTIVLFLVRFLIFGPEGFSWILAVIILLPGIGAIFLANHLSETLETASARARGLITSKEAAELVRHYGRTRLTDDVLPPDGLADEEELPESKERIKQALLIRLAEEKDEQTREQLKEGYLSLANYQAGVDQENTEFGASRLEIPSEFARQADIYEKWRPIVEQEHAELISDLKKVGYWGDEAQLT